MVQEEAKGKGVDKSREPIQVYGCICGFHTPNRREFQTHVFLSAKRDGKGTHKSIGIIDVNTGEVLLPPERERQPEDKSRRKGLDKGSVLKSAGTQTQQRTEIMAEASTIRFIPKVYTADYSPIMRAAQEAAVRLWGWREDMPFGNFIDTILFMFFEEKGITLAGYIISDVAQKELEEAQVAQITQATTGG